VTGGSGVGVLLLGAGHGLNPGMGWLFAVALGLQERSGQAVWRALGPLSVGHGLSIGAVLGAAAVLESVLPPGGLRWPTVALLAGVGLYRLLVNRHPRYGGMRVGFRDLTVWSFLMATAHGAGLMVLPLLPPAAGHADHLAGMMQPTMATALLQEGPAMALTRARKLIDIYADAEEARRSHAA
jgi:hypothetical protein